MQALRQAVKDGTVKNVSLEELDEAASGRRDEPSTETSEVIDTVTNGEPEATEVPETLETSGTSEISGTSTAPETAKTSEKPDALEVVATAGQTNETEQAEVAEAAEAEEIEVRLTGQVDLEVSWQGKPLHLKLYLG